MDIRVLNLKLNGLFHNFKLSDLKFAVSYFIVHLILFYSIFDIYFTSPLAKGMTPIKPSKTSPAKRIVLFVADGLRADSFFEFDENNQSRAPFLRNIIESNGIWGISHTRVPTESRPGHIAMIAGFYEDVSAVAKGWKENTVEFDSVFNRSRWTFSWGSPDILPMFRKGATGQHVFTDCYPPEYEDFSKNDSSALDTWVFNKVDAFFNDIVLNNQTINDMVNGDKVVFFLHLLGIDTNGHSHKPHSKQYLNNIKIIDNGIKKFINLFENFYNNDEKTSFIFTSDHGMTPWGTHGAGLPYETVTPLLAWGAGINKPIKENNHNSDPKWNLNHLKKIEIEQADITPLMASLIGIEFPVNSVGILPVEILNVEEDYAAEVAFINAKQISESFIVIIMFLFLLFVINVKQMKMAERKSTTFSFLFIPFQPLTDVILQKYIRNILHQQHEYKFKESIKLSRELIKLALEGLNYYHNYDRFFLELTIFMCFLGWLIYILMYLLKNYSNTLPNKLKMDLVQNHMFLLNTLITIITYIVIVLLNMQHLPWSYYIYSMLSIVIWYNVISIFLKSQVSKNLFVINWKILLTVFVCLLFIELMVFSFFYRNILTIQLICLGFLPYLTREKHLLNKYIKLFWSSCCFTVAIFPALPVIGRQANYNFIYASGLIVLCYVCMIQVVLKMRNNLYCYYAFSILISCYNIYSTNASILKGFGLPLINQIGSWVILLLSFFMPLFSPTTVRERLINIFLSFFNVYLLLSMSYETVFYMIFSCLLIIWYEMEYHLSSKNDLCGSNHLRISFVFFFFILVAFFGTGNIASINSFDTQSVYCFLTIFNPFIMGILMLIKIIIPFMQVACVLQAIHVSTCLNLRRLFLLILLISDFMALHFFFFIKDYGSWLEIGTSISHYVILMSFISVLGILIIIAKVLLCTSIKLEKLKHI